MRAVDILKRLLLAFVVSWGFAVTLGLLFAVAAFGKFSLDTLRLPGVVPVALLGSTIIALCITPIAAWSLRTGAKNLCIYGPVLWLALATYVVVVIPRTGPYGPYCLLLLAVVGLVVLGLIPPAVDGRVGRYP